MYFKSGSVSRTFLSQRTITMAKKNLSTSQKKIKFRKTLRSYLGFSIFFIVLNIFGGSNHFWAIYPIMGWGIGVIFEYSSLYGPLKDPYVEEEYEEFDLNRDRPNRRDRRRAEPLMHDNGRGYREEDMV